MIKVTFECDLGFVSGEYETEEKANNAYKWFAKRYREYHPHIKSVKEIISHGPTKSKL